MTGVTEFKNIPPTTLAGDVDYAVAGGNVCAVAQRRGIAAFVVDGVIRDLGEVRELGFPVFARGG